MIGLGARGGGKQVEDTFSLLEVMTDPKKYKKRLVELQEALVAAEEAVGGRDKIKNANDILADAQKKLATAEDKLRTAQVNSLELRNTAKQYYDDLLEKADKYFAEAKEKLAHADSVYRDKTKALDARESEITQKEQRLITATNAANAAKAEADRARIDYERRLDNLKKLVA